MNTFQDTAIAFDYKSNKELKRASFLFSMMKNFPQLSVWLARFGSYALQWKLPFAKRIIKTIFFTHFCGGETRELCTPLINRLSTYKVKTALDFGVEGKNTKEEHAKMFHEIIETIMYASDKEAVPVVSLKLTAIASFDLLEKYSADKSFLSSGEEKQFALLKDWVEQICIVAERTGKSIYLDAEESWIQPAVDKLALEMMIRFNKKRPVLFNTYQFYLKVSFDRLKEHRALCVRERSYFAAKLVRGAYLEKENNRARSLGLESPVQPSKSETDRAYDMAVGYCLDHYTDTYFALATHNEKSTRNVIEELNASGHPSDHIHFCQLYGMSDHITFSLANHAKLNQQGYQVMKYLPFGKMEDTYPYMIRRAEENTSVTSDVSKELYRINEELKRRKSAKQDIAML